MPKELSDNTRVVRLIPRPSILKYTPNNSINVIDTISNGIRGGEWRLPTFSLGNKSKIEPVVYLPLVNLTPNPKHWKYMFDGWEHPTGNSYPVLYTIPREYGIYNRPMTGIGAKIYF